MVGEGGVGKTALINRLRTGEFEPKYIATMGACVSSLRFHTSAGEVILNMWDCAGQERFGGLRTGYYDGAHGAILMFDVTSKVTYKRINERYNDIHQVTSNIPIVLCGNKVDCKDRCVKPSDIKFHRDVNMQYYDISVKSDLNSVKPFLYLIRKLLGDNSIVFVKTPSIPPPEIPVSQAQIEEWENELSKY
jgi:GTP-binding nuclear protein Ran